MKQLILKFVKSLGVQAVFRNNTIEGPIKIIQIDFFGSDEKYHSIAVGYNSTRIFNIQGTNLIGEADNNALQYLDCNHRVFETREDWVTGRFPSIDKKHYELFCKSLKASEKIVSYNDFVLNRIELTLDPIFAYILFYSYKGVEQKSLILVADQCTDCSNLFKDNHNDFLNFIKLCGFEDNVSSDKLVKALEVFENDNRGFSAAK